MMRGSIRNISIAPAKTRDAKSASLLLVNSIQSQIKNGQLKYGDRLPSLRDIAEKHSVSFRVARNAFEKLEQNGIVKCIQGNGTYVAKRKESLRSADVSQEVHLILQKTYYVTSTLTPLIIDELQNQGYITTVAIDHERGDKENRAIEKLEKSWSKSPPSAIVLEGGSERIDNLIKQCAHPATRIITTFRNRNLVHRGWHSVQPDLQGAYYMAGKHLLAQGHDGIGLIMKNENVLSDDSHYTQKKWESNTMALAGTYEAFHEANIKDNIAAFTPDRSRHPEDTSDLNESERLTVDRAMKWIKENHITAVVGQEPWLFYVKLAARWLNLRVPKDMAVIGIGQADSAYRGEYPCVDWCCRKISQEVAKIITTDERELGEVTRHVIVPAKWVDTRVWPAALVG